jgi:hypothetical protein
MRYQRLERTTEGEELIWVKCGLNFSLLHYGTGHIQQKALLTTTLWHCLYPDRNLPSLRFIPGVLAGFNLLPVCTSSSLPA